MSGITSLSELEKSEVRAALENSLVEFSQMEDTFNKNRYKSKWVQSTSESANMGQKTRTVEKLVDACNKSKSIPF